MNPLFVLRVVLLSLAFALPVVGAPVIDPISDLNVPAGKSIIVPVTATSPNGRPLTFTASSSTNGIAVIVHTNNPFWKLSVAQAAPANAPGAYQTPYRGGTVTVTNIGDMTFMLFRDLAPHTVDVIQGFTDSGLYTSNTIFHRVVPGFVIQGGDPSTNGMGGPVFRYDDEFDATAIFSGNGQLALANSGKDTDGSQFFVTLGAQRPLDFGYTIFGQLLRGFNVLTNVINTPTDTNSRPTADVIITRASLVPDNFDTVLTLTGTNRLGVKGTIKVIADDGAGGRTTNSFTATTAANTFTNNQPFLLQTMVTNLVAPMNVTLTNVLNAVGLDGEPMYWFPQFDSQASYNAASNSSYSLSNGLYKSLTYNVTNVQGQMQFFLKPSTNYAGPVTLYFIVSSSSLWNYFPSSFPYDKESFTFAFGDTPIAAQAVNFTAQALKPFTNQLIATFTNGVPVSDATNFTAFINWGDNSTNSGVILTDQFHQKEVLGAHTYTNAGDYPVYVTIQSALGVTATAVSTASVPPFVTLARMGTNNLVRWPAWATTYQLQTSTNLTSANWINVANIPVLEGYDLVATNASPNGELFFRLSK